MKRILQFILTGLGTVPIDATVSVGSADDCGMLTTAQHIRDAILKGPQFVHRIDAVGWDQFATPDDACRYLLQVISDFVPDEIVIHAHSFGNSLLCFFGHWMERWHPEWKLRIGLVFGYDPCRILFPPIFGALDWVLNPSLFADVYSWYNADAWRCWGVVGTPFRFRSFQSDVTAWEPELAHVNIGIYQGIPQSPAIRAQVYAIVAQELGHAEQAGAAVAEGGGAVAGYTTATGDGQGGN